MTFYHPVKIGNLDLSGNLFLAPVAGYSDRAFRSICVEGGAAFTYTEMVSAEALTRGSGKTEALMSRAPNESAYAVQIFGGNARTMADAAKIVLEKTSADCIDINCGCPVPKIIKTGAGSALTKEPEKLYEVVSAVVNAVGYADSATKAEEKNAAVTATGDTNVDLKNEATNSAKRTVPVTVKIRSGWDNNNITWKEAALAAIDAGASAITIHPRTRAQGYEGKSDWDILRQLVEFAAGKIPVFGSGEIFSPEDAKNMLEQTGCSGVMFARGAMGHPFIFRQTRQLLETGSYEEISLAERINAGFKELDLLIQDKGEEVACREMRKRFCAYSKGISGGSELRRKLVNASTREEYKLIFNF